MRIAPTAPLDWNDIDLVVFDVDGTLYRQGKLRLRMLVSLLIETTRTGNWRLPKTLHTFRQCREALGEKQTHDFMSRQYVLAARKCHCLPGEVREIVEEWMERRPLPHLRACRYPGIDRLFHALAGAGKTIAVLSDYPAVAKLQALDLKADIVVAATDPEVGQLKPHPAGLRRILASTGTPPHRALMIGDRADRDGEVARRVGMRALIRSPRLDLASGRFRTYTDAPFQPLLAQLPEPAPTPSQRHGTADAL